VLYWSDGIVFKGRPFTIGGYNAETRTDTYEIDVNKLELISKAHLLLAKYYHTLCQDAYSIYSVGGVRDLYEGVEELTDDCEKYVVADDKWL